MSYYTILNDVSIKIIVPFSFYYSVYMLINDLHSLFFQSYILFYQELQIKNILLATSSLYTYT